jgi:hypothetical protein
VPARLGYRYLGDEFVRDQTFSVWRVTRADWTAGAGPTAQDQSIG